VKTPQVTWLRSFEAAARRGSFSAAADDLGLTPAAVSQQIRLLEKHLGVQLFDRLPKGVVLTDTGQAYAQPIRKSFSEMQAATEGLFGAAGRKTVKVRSSISYAALVLAPQLGAFRTRYPDIDVQLSTAVWSDRIDHDDIDIDVRYGNGEWDDGTIWHLGDEYASVVCSPAFAASFGDKLSFEALYGASVVQIIGSETEWVRMQDHYGLHLRPPATWLKADSSLIAIQIIASGVGAAIVMENFSKPFVAQGSLVDPLPYRLPIQQSYFLVVTDKAGKRDEVRSLCRWIAGE
jgi:LysR family glycine cleavage system transcriptional activator